MNCNQKIQFKFIELGHSTVLHNVLCCECFFFVCLLLLLLSDNSVIKTRKVKEIMTETDRKYYCPRSYYVDEPQNIGNGVTISAPHMVCQSN